MARAINGNAVRQLRALAGITVRGLAEQCGVHHSTIVRVEQGKRRSHAKVSDLERKLAVALGVPVERITLPSQEGSQS